MHFNNPEAIALKARLDQLKQRILGQAEAVTGNMKLHFDKDPRYIVFLSFSDGKSRAYVCNGIGNSIESSWKNAVNNMNKKVKKLNLQPLWVKADLVKDIQEYSFDAFIEYVSSIKTNYFREGIALDEMFNLAFLEQEVNANVFIYGNKESPKKQISWKNIMAHIRYKLGLKLELDENSCKKVWLFSTTGFFHDGTDCYHLNHDWLNNGRRVIEVIDEGLLRSVIEKSSGYLADQVDDSGKFRYGYFPCFNKEIPGYNTLRHASTTYSMIEAFEITKDERLGQAIILALDYLANEGIELLEGEDGVTRAFVVERTSDNEIKLGANATAILAFSKYTAVFDDRRYVQLMKQLAEGISYFQDKQEGSYVHVLNFPDLSIKEKFRTVYYNGEAAFALMRLYDIDKNERWLNMVELAFEYFINNEYWRQKDHWLSYCSNELFKHRAEKKYIEFNLKNASGILDFCLSRETTYPTLLELLMATYSMIEKMKTDQYCLELLDSFDQEKLMAAIEHRVEHQLNGLYFPEVAMYYKAPQNILWAFYIRHHSFRSRIDDIEHNISGYCSYLKQIVIPAGQN
ncbi:MAG TPA: thioredoxin [Syntrophomonas sp.]|jgi:hypothetical protein|nr:thioredoxin [Syntrophomonas sp.]